MSPIQTPSQAPTRQSESANKPAARNQRGAQANKSGDRQKSGTQPHKAARTDTLQSPASARPAPRGTPSGLKPPLHPNTKARLRTDGERLPKPAEARLLHEATALRDAEKHGDAEKRWVKLLAMRPNDVGVLLDLTHCLQLQSEKRSAHDPTWTISRLLDRLTGLDPQKQDQREALGSALFLSAWQAHLDEGGTARFGQALPYLREVLQRRPNDPTLLALVGACQIGRRNARTADRDMRTAEKLFARAQDLHDRLPNSFMRLRAFSLDLQGRHGEAESWYRRALSISANDPRTLGELGVNLVAQHGHSPEAEKLLTRALAKSPASARYARALARAKEKPVSRWKKTLRALATLLPPQTVLSAEDVVF